MPSFVVPSNGVYWLQPSDFGFPPGATLEEYKDYWVVITSYPQHSWPTVWVRDLGNYGPLEFFPDYDWGQPSFNGVAPPYIRIWFGDITTIGLYGADILPEEAPLVETYTISYNIETMANLPIVIDSSDDVHATPFPSIIEVSGIGPAYNMLEVTIENLDHTWVNDLSVILVGPSGNACFLFWHIYGSEDIDQTFTFSGNGLDHQDFTEFTSGSSLKPMTKSKILSVWGGNDWEYWSKYEELNSYRDVYDTLEGLLAFEISNGTVNGDWKLYMSDYAGGDGGDASGWSLTFLSPSSIPLTYQALTTGTNSIISTDNTTFTIVTTNQAPSHVYPTALSARKIFVDSTKYLSLQVNDNAEAGCVLSTVLSTTHGTISVNDTTSGAIISGQGTSSVSIEGTKAQINAAISAFNTSITITNIAPPNFLFTISTNDNGCSGPGGALTTTNTFTLVTVYPLSPEGVDSNVYVRQGDQVNISYENFKIVDTAEDGYLSDLKHIIIQTLPDAGLLTWCGSNVFIGQVLTKAQLQQNCLIYTATAAAATALPKSVVYSFSYLIVNDVDVSLIQSGGSNQSVLPSYVYLNVILDYALPIPPLPLSIVTVNESERVNINANNFGYNTFDEMEAISDLLIISSLPSSGTLYINEEEAQVGSTCSIKDLSYQAPASVTSSTPFDFSVILSINPATLYIPISATSFGPISYSFNYGQLATIIPNPSEITIDTSMSLEKINITMTARLGCWSKIELRIVNPDDIGTVLYYKNWQNNVNEYTLSFRDDYAYLSSSPPLSGSINAKPSPGLLDIGSVNYGDGLPLSPTLDTPGGVGSGKWLLYIIDSVTSDNFQGPSLGISSWSVNAVITRVVQSSNLTVNVSGVIEPVNDAPRIVVSHPIVTQQLVDTVIDGITLYDPDSYPLNVSVKISCSHGILTFTSTTGVAVTGNASSEVIVSGSFVSVKSIIEAADNLRYITTGAFTGQDTAVFTVTTDSSIRVTGLNIYVKQEKLINGNYVITNTLINHGEMKDTAIRIYYNDPRTDGRYYVGDQIVNDSPKLVPDFDGQLVAYLEYTTDWKAYLLCGYFNGVSLQWKDVTSNGVLNGDVSIDIRTGLPYDPYWSSRCDPPWVCD